MNWTDRILPRKLYDLVIIDLPAIPMKDLQGAVSHHIEGLYPGEINADLLDYLPIKSSKGWLVFIYLIHPADKPEVDRCLLEKRDIPLANMLLKERALTDYTHAYYPYRQGVELFILENGTPYQSRYLPKTDIDNLYSVLPPDAKSIDLTKLGKGLTLRRGLSLFSPQRKTQRLRKLVLGAFGLLIVMLLFGLGILTSQRQQQRLQDLKEQYERILQFNMESIQDEESLLALKLDSLYMDSLTTPKAYGVLSELSSQLSSRGSLDRFAFREDGFVLVGAEYKPLEYLQRLESLGKFRNLKMHKIVPLETGKDQFTLIGEVLR